MRRFDLRVGCRNASWILTWSGRFLFVCLLLVSGRRAIWVGRWASDRDVSITLLAVRLYDWYKKVAGRGPTHHHLPGRGAIPSLTTIRLYKHPLSAPLELTRYTKT